MSTSRFKVPYVSLYPVTSKVSGVTRYRITYTLNGRRVTERLGLSPGKAQKRARMVSDLIDSIKCNLVPPEEAKRLVDDHRHLSQHVKRYEQSLRSKKCDAVYTQTTIQRINTLLDLMGATRAAHVTAGATEKALGDLGEQKKKDGRGDPTDETLAPQTINHYLRAIKQFVRWMKRTGVITSDPLENVAGVKVAGDIRHPRRAPTIEELQYLVAFVTTEPKRRWRAMLGEDRAFLYTFAFCTGLRAEELYSAEAAWLKLDRTPAVLVVPGKFTKNGQEASQPLPAWLVTACGPWLQSCAARRSAGEPASGDRGPVKLFPGMPMEPGKLFKRDLNRARAQWVKEQLEAKVDAKQLEASPFLKHKTDEGFLDFHALRHGYGSTLAESDAPIKLIQHLMRHSTIELTMDRYAHARQKRAAEAVDQAIPNVMPQPGSASDNAAGKTSRETTGTREVKKTRQRKAQRSTDNIRRESTPSDGNRRKQSDKQSSGNDKEIQGLSDYPRQDSNL